MRIYIICAVRNATEEEIAGIRHSITALREQGHDVHFPPDDVEQNDPTGRNICEVHRRAMQTADEVHVFWDVTSSGSHFDLGMAYALDKKIVPRSIAEPDPPHKSYWKAVIDPNGELNDLGGQIQS